MIAKGSSGRDRGEDRTSRGGFVLGTCSVTFDSRASRPRATARVPATLLGCHHRTQFSCRTLSPGVQDLPRSTSASEPEITDAHVDVREDPSSPSLPVFPPPSLPHASSRSHPSSLTLLPCSRAPVLPSPCSCSSTFLLPSSHTPTLPHLPPTLPHLPPTPPHSHQHPPQGLGIRPESREKFFGEEGAIREGRGRRGCRSSAPSGVRTADQHPTKLLSASEERTLPRHPSPGSPTLPTPRRGSASPGNPGKFFWGRVARTVTIGSGRIPGTGAGRTVRTVRTGAGSAVESAGKNFSGRTGRFRRVRDGGNSAKGRRKVEGGAFRRGEKKFSRGS